MGARESSVVRAIRREAKKHVPRLVLRKKHGTAYGIAADPDLYGVFDGRAWVFEAKQKGKEPTLLQFRRLQEWAAAGALAGWGGLQQFKELLGLDRAEH